MNDLVFLDSFYESQNKNINFLVTGNDPLIHNAFMKKVLQQSKQKQQPVIVIDDSDDTMFQTSIATKFGFNVKNGMDEESCLYNLIPINIKKRTLEFRETLNILNYSEEKKGKLFAYLEFIDYFEREFYGNNSGDIDLATLAKYGSSIQVDMKLSELLSEGKLDSKQKEYLQARYTEVSSAGADFENALFILEPLVTGKVISILPNEILRYSISQYDRDITMKNLIFSLFLNFIKQNRNVTVIILNKSYGEQSSVYDFINHFPAYVEIHLFSEDAFTICSECERGKLFNRFQMRIYGHHASEISCKAVSTECGEIDVKKTSYSVTYDRKLRSNNLLDVLTGHNKQEVYTTTAAIREPRYRKEMIASFYPGSGIAQYQGKTLLFSL